MAAILVILSNGPVFLFAKSVLNRPGHWEDWAVWPFFAAAATASAALVVADRGRPVRRPEGTAQWTAATAVAWFSLLAVTSTAWSVDPAATAWRSMVYVGLSLLAWVISGLDSKDLWSVLAALSGAAVVASAFLVALRPDLGLDANGAWEGVYTNRNSLAPLAALGVLVGMRCLWAGRLRQKVGGGGLATMSLVAMAGAGSRTAWLALGVAAGVSGALVLHRPMRLRWDRNRAALVLIAAAAAGAAGVGAAVVASWNVTTLAQRRTMWSLVWDLAAQRPVQGYGFFTFWDIEELTQHVLLRRGSAHNSLLEVGLGLGLLGTVPFLVIVSMAAWNAGIQAWRSPGPDAWMWAAVVAFVLVENVTESFVLWFSYTWVLLMAAALRPCPARGSAPRVKDDGA